MIYYTGNATRRFKDILKVEGEEERKNLHYDNNGGFCLELYLLKEASG
jgi:hypothetical protein